MCRPALQARSAGAQYRPAVLAREGKQITPTQSSKRLHSSRENYVKSLGEPKVRYKPVIACASGHSTAIGICRVTPESRGRSMCQTNGTEKVLATVCDAPCLDAHLPLLSQGSLSEGEDSSREEHSAPALFDPPRAGELGQADRRESPRR